MLMLPWELEWALVQPTVSSRLKCGQRQDQKETHRRMWVAIVCWFESLARNVFKATNGNSHPF